MLRHRQLGCLQDFRQIGLSVVLPQQAIEPEPDTTPRPLEVRVVLVPIEPREASILIAHDLVEHKPVVKVSVCAVFGLQDCFGSVADLHKRVLGWGVVMGQTFHVAGEVRTSNANH
jgi:hypothetical protein